MFCLINAKEGENKNSFRRRIKMQRILKNTCEYLSVLLILTLAIVACDGNGGESKSIGSGP